MIITHQSDYATRRREKYPAISDQLDLLYKGFKQMAGDGSTLPPAIAEWVSLIQEIKDTYPKPSK